MQLLQALLPLAALFPSALGQVHNTTREFNLKTVVIAGQQGKAAYDNLWLLPYHTGAGLNDVVLSPQRDTGIKGFLNATGTSAKGQQYSNLIFDFGNPFPWQMVMETNVDVYAAWQPTAINAGGGGNGSTVNGFYIDAQGLQWSPETDGTTNGLGRWLVCDWWHLSPQLFVSIPRDDNDTLPATCARVHLQPVYL